MTVLLALVPIGLLVLCLAGLRWPAAWAASAAAASAAAVAALGFGYGGEASDWLGPAAEAAFVGLTILWIVFGALCIHEHQTASGSIDAFRQWMSRFGSDRRVTALLIAWFFALFLEGAAGFGTPVALAAPLLVALGFSPPRALTLVLIGHAAGVSFGAVGTPVIPLLQAYLVSPAVLASGIALLHAALGWALAGLVARIAGNRRRTAGTVASWQLAGAAAAAFFLPYVLLAAWIGPELPTLGGALAGAFAFVVFARRGAAAHRPGGTKALPAALAASALPYLLVIALILATRAAPPVREALSAARIDWSLDGRFAGSAAPLVHPGTILIIAFLATGLARRGGILPAARKAAGRLPVVALTLFAVLLLARLMVHSGMIALLAATAAAAFGAAWPAAAPMVGALGSFVAGSATASNILFAEFQIATASAAGVAPLLALVGQGMGAGAGNMIAPHNIVAGAATVGLVGGEGKILRRTLPVCIVYTAAAGLLLLAASLLGLG